MSDPPRAPDGMIWTEGATFRMGSDGHYPEEAPSHRVAVDGFWIDRYQVTNERFAAFVAATGYVTVAERPLDPAAFPGAPPENLVPGSLVFTMTPGPVDLRHTSQWWTWTPGASWRGPEGPRSTVAGRENRPVVHVALDDAEAYASWAGKELPTEAEWELAARGGLEGARFTWGDEPERPGERLANYWHGEFPWRPDPGYGTTMPVGSFPANGLGLHDMAGNVWEWTTDWFQGHGEIADACCTMESPRGSRPEQSFDPTIEGVRIPRRVMKGGSHLCAPNYCRRYRPAARMAQAIDTSTSHLGFRCMIRT